MRWHHCAACSVYWSDDDDACWSCGAEVEPTFGMPTSLTTGGMSIFRHS